MYLNKLLQYILEEFISISCNNSIYLIKGSNEFRENMKYIHKRIKEVKGYYLNIIIKFCF